MLLLVSTLTLTLTAIPGLGGELREWLCDQQAAGHLFEGHPNTDLSALALALTLAFLTLTLSSVP